MNPSKIRGTLSVIPFKSMPASLKHSTVSLLLFNLFPLIGVLFFRWDIAGVMLLYWSENIIVGFFNVLKLWRAEGTSPAGGRASVRKISPATGKFGEILFFIIHYGMFTAAHGVFVLALFGTPEAGWGGIALAAFHLFLSHGISYRRNFIRGGEYKNADRSRLFFQPYKRIFVMHLTIIIGGGFAKVIGAPPLALVVMIALKMLIDQQAHRREHAKFRHTETQPSTGD